MSRRVCAGGVFALSLVVAATAAAEDPVLPALVPRPCSAESGQLPASVRVDRSLLPRVATMMQRSPTFRRQCRRLADAPWVHVLVRVEGFFEPRAYRAWTVIQRPRPRLVVAIVTIQWTPDSARWVSHEFEHLIEQIDGVNVRALALGTGDAWPAGGGMFETARAVRAGDSVLEEVRGRRRDDTFVD